CPGGARAGGERDRHLVGRAAGIPRDRRRPAGAHAAPRIRKTDGRSPCGDPDLGLREGSAGDLPGGNIRTIIFPAPMTTRFLNDHGVIARYRQYLPVTDMTPVISLNEGSTPLIHSPKLSKRVGRGCNVFLKYEGLNPTGSFKDRGMTMAISKAAE